MKFGRFKSRKINLPLPYCQRNKKQFVYGGCYFCIPKVEEEESEIPVLVPPLRQLTDVSLVPLISGLGPI